MAVEQVFHLPVSLGHNLWTISGRRMTEPQRPAVQHNFMAKRSDTLNTTVLALELLRRIPRNRRATAAELHEQLSHAGIERDIRTIQRLLETLCQHFDIECDDRSKPYGYRWKVYSSGLSLPALSEQEALLLLLAEEHLSHFLPRGVMKSMEGFFLQARTKLGPCGTSKPIQQWLRKIRVVNATQPTLPPKIDEDVFHAVSNALYTNHWLELEYRNVTGKSSEARVMPLGLAQQGVRLYLVCRYEGYAEERILALHRIVSARVAELSFERPADFDLERYDADGKFGFGNGKRLRLRFSTDKETGFHLLESPLSTDQQAVDSGDRFDISATVVETVQLHRWLRGFGPKVWDIRFDDADDKSGAATEEAAALRHILS